MLLACMAQVAAWAQQGTCGTDVTWSLDGPTINIDGSGRMDDYFNPNGSDSLPPWHEWKDKIERVVVKGGVTYVGRYAFYGCHNLEKVELGEGVTMVGSNAFRACAILKNVSLPETLEQIGDAWAPYTDYGSAFADCPLLRSITLPKGLKFVGANAFSGCSGMEKLYWNAADCDVQLNFRNESAFLGCGFTEVEFGETVKRLPQRAFCNVGALAVISTKGSIEEVGEQAFHGTGWIGRKESGKMIYIDHAAYLYIPTYEIMNPFELNIREGTVSISDGAAEGCEWLSSVTLPTTISHIGKRAFHDCPLLKTVNYNCVSADDMETSPFDRALTTITFGQSVKNIPACLLYERDSVVEINLPKSLESIGAKAFSGCDSVRSLVIPDSVRSLGRLAVYDMRDLESITIGEGLKDMDYYFLFDRCPKLKVMQWNAIHLNEKSFDVYHTTDGCKAPIEEVVFGDKVEYIPGQLFWKNSTLNRVAFGQSLKKIGEAAFRECAALKEIYLPDGVEEICADAFYRTSLSEVFIPKSVKTIGSWAFKDIDSLQTMIVTPTEAPQGNGNVNKGNVYVPDAKHYGWLYNTTHLPMLKASRDTFVYSGSAPQVSFSSNIPGYVLTSVDMDKLDGGVGDHTAVVTASFEGRRNFTVDIKYYYVVVSGDDTAVDCVAGDNIEVSGHNGCLYLKSSAAGIPVYIHSVDGKLQKSLTTDGHEMCLPLPSGVWIVKAKHHTFKISL